MRKPAFCICENKDADQLRGNREADQRLCFRYTDSTIPLLFKSDISSFCCVGPDRKPRRQVFSQRSSFHTGHNNVNSWIAGKFEALDNEMHTLLRKKTLWLSSLYHIACIRVPLSFSQTHFGYQVYLTLFFVDSADTSTSLEHLRTKLPQIST